MQMKGEKIGHLYVNLGVSIGCLHDIQMAVCLDCDVHIMRLKHVDCDTTDYIPIKENVNFKSSLIRQKTT